jgi:hypothetical protein
LKVPIVELQEPFDRLRINAIFSPKYNARSDKDLKGDNKEKKNEYLKSKHYTEICWGIVAGIAQGYTGIR